MSQAVDVNVLIQIHTRKYTGSITGSVSPTKARGYRLASTYLSHSTQIYVFCNYNAF